LLPLDSSRCDEMEELLATAGLTDAG
jgi:hypothetical protein